MHNESSLRSTWMSCFVACGLSLSACAGSQSTEPQVASAPAPPSDESMESAEPLPPEEDEWEGEGDVAEDEAAPASEGAVEEADDGPAETRTMKVIQDVVLQNRDAVRACYEKALEKMPSLKGDLVIHFVVDPEGNVKLAEPNLERSTIKSPEVSSCAVDVIKQVKFPPSSRGMQTTVNYPFNLNP